MGIKLHSAPTPTGICCDDSWTNPHVEEPGAFGEGMMPVLRERGLLEAPT